jgi:hypothetical protein
MNWNLVWRATKDSNLKDLSPILQKMALEYLLRTHDADGFMVMVRGC